jgi:hypothetical protein
VVKDPQGRIGNKLVGPLLTDHADAYAAQCEMK